MSGLSSILNIANSGLQTAQTGLRTVSDNVSNVNTPGYIRKVADQQSVSVNGQGGGVDIVAIRLAADKFLQAAGLQASAQSGAAAAKADTLDQAQALYGDPNDATSFFSQLNTVFSGFAALSSDSTTATRGAALAQVQSFFDQANTISGGLATLANQADSKVSDDVATANDLIKQIDGLNADISRSRVLGRDTTGAQNQQSGLVDQLSQLLTVKVGDDGAGNLVLRTSNGLPLTGVAGPSTLSYDTSSGSGRLQVAPPGGGAAQPLSGDGLSGEIKGLVDLRNTDLPAIGAQLGEFVSGAAEALNAAHNASASTPAASSLAGRSTWLSASEAFSGITGKTTVDIVDASGAVQRKVDVDFGAGTISVNGGAPSAFTAAGFPSALNTALGASGSASFDASGKLTINASAAGTGVAIADDATTPSSKAGRGFSDFFGLNDLVTATEPTNAATGTTSAAPANFTGNLTVRLTGADGTPFKDVTVNTGAAATVGDLVNALNASTTGVGLYGSFALDDTTGTLAFTPAPNSGVTLSVVSDSSQRGTGGPGASVFFNIGDVQRATRASAFSVRGDLVGDPSRLSIAHLDPTVAVGGTALYASDASGADALAQAGRSTVTFQAAGGLAGGAQQLSNYAAGVSASVANRAASAATAQTSAAAVATEATTRRSAVEGVNLDEELTSMTTYQQAYNASARLIQTARDMFDVLLNMT